MSQGKPNFRDTEASREARSLISGAADKAADSRISDRPSASLTDLRIGAQEKARELGFCAVGFARADAAPASGERLRQWLAEGAHGDMIWMEETAERRASPAGLWPEVKSVIALGMSYAPASDPL